MRKLVTIERKGQTKQIVLRQMPHDPKAVIGGKIHYGSGAMWLVLAVESFDMGDWVAMR